MLTVAEVQRMVAGLDSIRRDDEVAHSEEDAIHFRVLTAIAEGSCEDPRACAAEALKTAEIEFARWCA